MRYKKTSSPLPSSIKACSEVTLVPSFFLMVLPWKRFWVPLGSQISCGISGQGFFDDPEAEPGFLNKTARRLDDLVSEECLVLLGEPGLGKSIALEQAFPEINHAAGGDQTTIWIRFRDIPDASTFTRRILESFRWRSWIEGDHRLTLVLDGLDEGLIKIKNFVSFLTSELRSCPLNRLRLLVACRTADWPIAAGEHLLDLWKSTLAKGVWELCPLRWIDAVSAAESDGVSPVDFLDQVFARNVITLAARPTTLFFLLRQFKSDGQLGGSHREIYERGVLDLCREPDPERAEANKFSEKESQIISPEKLRDGAALLAAMLVLSGRSALSTSNREDPAEKGDLNLHSLVENEKVRGSGNQLHVFASVNTALFSSGGENRVGFAHQSFAECLAARQVSNLPLVQLRRLFCGMDDNEEHVIPQLAETAAWLAGSNDDFLTHLLKIDPGVLLRSDVTRIQGNRQEQIVRAILEAFKELELFDDFDTRRFLSGLKHDRLAEQLWEYVKDDTLNVIVRRVALDIAEECKLAELNDTLLGMLSRPGVDQQVKERAARVLVKTLADEQLNKLEPLVHGSCGPDPEDQLKGYGLARLVPGYWRLSQSLAHISPPKDWQFHGAYDSFLNYRCPGYITVEDLPALLSWLVGIDQCFDVLNPFCGLAYGAMCLALRHLDQPQIRDPGIRLWKKDLYRQRSHRSRELAKLWGNQSIRQSFACYILQDPQTTEHDVSHLFSFEFPLLEGSDLGWVLERLPTIDQNRQPIWAHAVWLLTMRHDITEWWDLFLQRLEIPALKSRFSLVRAWDMNEPVARKAKADHLRQQRRRHRFERGISASDLQARIEEELERISEGNSSRWVNLCHYLPLEEGDKCYPPFLHHDVTQMPGWLVADEKRRSRIKAAARSFLIDCSDDFETLQARSTFSDPGYLAIWLLRDEFYTDEELQRSVAKNWINTIVGRVDDAVDHHEEMVALAYRLNGDATIDALRQDAEESFRRGDGHILTWRPFARCWDARLTAVLEEFTVSHWTKRASLTTSLCFLFEHDSVAFQRWMRRVLPRIKKLPYDTRVTIAAVAHALAPAETWDAVWSMIVEDKVFGEKVLLTIASNVVLGDRRKAPSLTPDKLGKSVELLYSLFPPSESERKSGYVTPRQAVADHRCWMLDLLTTCPDSQAGEELIRLANVFPQHAIEFRYRYQDHLKTRRRLLWQPPPPVDLIEIMIDQRLDWCGTGMTFSSWCSNLCNGLKTTTLEKNFQRSSDSGAGKKTEIVRRNLNRKTKRICPMNSLAG